MTSTNTVAAVPRLLGRSIERHALASSTSDLARAHAHAGAAEGLVVLAEEQTLGRGRRGRNWVAPPGTCLLLTVLLRPVWLPPDAAFALTMLAGVAVCDAVEASVPALHAALKWPNDLLLPATPLPNAPLQKAAGILSELVLDAGQISFVTLGIGINVNWSPSGLVDGRDLGATATSLCAAAGHTVDRAALLDALLGRIDAGYAQLRRGQREAIFNAWRARLVTLGHDVTVVTPSGGVTGTAEDVDATGALRLRSNDGQLHVITAGDVGGYVGTRPTMQEPGAPS